MKRVYEITRFNGTYDYVAEYLPDFEAACAAAKSGKAVSTYLVPDGWGTPEFTDWTDAERSAADLAGVVALSAGE